MTVDLRLGDCISLMRDIPDGSVDMVLCDLPFGTTQNSWDSVIPLNSLWEQYNRISKTNAAIVLFSQCPFDKVLGASNLSALKYEWIWEKSKSTGYLNARRAPMKSHENILVFCRGRLPYYPIMEYGKPYTNHHKAGDTGENYGENKDYSFKNDGTRFPKDVIKFKSDQAKDHPTQKPVALLEYLIRTYTNEGDTVLDSTMGSGSTGVACVSTGRNFIGIELLEQYFDIARHRISDAEERARKIADAPKQIGLLDMA